MNCWILNYLINNERSYNFFKKKILITYLKYSIIKVIKKNIIYNFSLSREKKIEEELNRNFRVVFMCLNDFYNKDFPNVMNRDIDEIIYK